MSHPLITSTANPLIKEVLRTKEKRGVGSSFVIEGVHLVDMALSCPAAVVERVFFAEHLINSEQGRRLMDRLKETTVQTIRASKKVIDKLSDTETPQGIVAVISLNVPSLDAIPLKAVPMLIVCDGISDPGNIGTIVRVADASGADAVLLTPGTCDPFMPKAVRASAGSIFALPVLPETGVEEIVGFLAERHIRLYAADVRASKSLYETDFRGPAAIIFGNEAHGIGANLLNKAELLLKIPVIGRAESLNVAMAASISLYEAVRQRGLR
ncbi:MAG: RNA methyltransferase [Nitrospirae bacterium]|nr:RNA methyltransferase [Nitrospirota bacterium]